MRRLVQLFALIASAVLLAAMMVTTPDFNSSFRAIPTYVESGGEGQTRLVKGRFLDWQIADRIVLQGRSEQTMFDTQGKFLIADLEVGGVQASTVMDATWIGASGRQYFADTRIPAYQGGLKGLWLQPGLTDKARVIFELPPDEIAGGRLKLGWSVEIPLEGILILDPPAHPPAEVAEVEVRE